MEIYGEDDVESGGCQEAEDGLQIVPLHPRRTTVGFRSPLIEGHPAVAAGVVVRARTKEIQRLEKLLKKSISFSQFAFLGLKAQLNPKHLRHGCPYPDTNQSADDFPKIRFS